MLVTSVLCLLLTALFWLLHQELWKRKWVRRTLWLLPLFTFASMLLWGLGYRLKETWLIRTGSIAGAMSLVAQLGLLIGLPFSGAINQIRRWLDRRASTREPASEDRLTMTRRGFLKGTAVAFPLASVVVGKLGIARSFGSTRVELIRLPVPGLPPGLVGMRILHLTDSHLGILRFQGDMEKLLDRASGFSPDLVAWTGDIADDLRLLPDALAMSAALNPPLGAFGCLGNHEYGRGVEKVLRIFDRSPVRLLRSSGVTLERNGCRLFLAGADDPRRMRGDHRLFLDGTVRRALAERPEETPAVLLAHRPEAFDHAAQQGVELTLAGHTHGGQVGVNGRSFWASFMPGRYLWGLYRKQNRQMYLSSGIGHWFPFRLGCPPEAPVIELFSA